MYDLENECHKIVQNRLDFRGCRMKDIASFIGVDLGASGGRLLLARWDGTGFRLEELHRFLNGPVSVLGSLYWDVLYLWGEIKKGLSRYCSLYGEPLAGIGVDTWGLDFALIDGKGMLLGNPYHYRDLRTEGMPQLAFQRVSREEIFERTGHPVHANQHHLSAPEHG